MLFLSPLFLLVLILFPSSNSPNELSTVIERTMIGIPLGIITLYFLFNYLFSIFGHTELEINYQDFCLKYALFGFKRQIRSKTENITEAKFTYDILAGGIDNSFWTSVVGKCLIIEGTKNHQFGRYITRIEKEWLIKEINGFLGKLVID